MVACKGSDTQLYLVIDRADSPHGLSNECGMGNWDLHGSDEHQLRTTDCEAEFVLVHQVDSRLLGQQRGSPCAGRKAGLFQDRTGQGHPGSSFSDLTFIYFLFA